MFESRGLISGGHAHGRNLSPDEETLTSNS